MNPDYLNIGRSALAIGAWEEAKEALEMAAKQQSTPEALEELAWANWWLNDMTRVFDLRERAHQAFLKRKDKQGASRTASWLGLDYLEYSGAFAVASGWFQRAESLLEGIGPCKERCTINTLKANLSFRVEKNIPQALSLLNETIAMSKSIEAVECLMLAEGLKGFVLVTMGMVKEGMQLLDEATVLALGKESNDIRSITVTCCFLIDACQRVRDYDRAGQWCVQVKEICKRWRHKAVFATCRTQYASVLISKGEWADAEEELKKAIGELEQLKPASLPAGIIRLADLRRRQGRWSEAMTLLESTTAGTKALPLAALLYDMGEFRQACDVLERFLRKIPATEKTERVAGLELFIQINVQLDQLPVTESCLGELEDIAAEIGTKPLQAAWLQAKGIVQFGQMQYDLSRKNLEDAVDLYVQHGSSFEAARARLWLAESLEALKHRSRAEQELNHAIKTFKELGAKRDLEKARQRLKETGFARGNNTQGFTRRELDLLRLVADGKSNEQISDALSISLRTVEKHLSNIYQKLGIAGKSARAYAASFASKQLPK